jgi:cyanophycinase
MRKFPALACKVILAMILPFSLALAQNDTLLMPIGGGYADTFPSLIKAAAGRARGSSVSIVVLPVTYSSNASSITEAERKLNLSDAEKRRAQLEAACNRGVPAGKRCHVTLAPVFTRADAEDPKNVALINPDLAAVFFLGGDQTVAARALVDTPLEQALADAYHRGVLIAGTSAGLSVQSQDMIAGYQGKSGPSDGLNKGTLDLWDSANRRGLDFGITNAVMEQHFWERGRLPRLLNALAQPGVPGVGIGVDTYTGALISDGSCLEGISGRYTVAVLDAEAFGAAKRASYPHDILSIHNVLFHLLAPGDFSFDINTRMTSLAAPPKTLRRDFDMLRLQDGAGPLLVAGNLLRAANGQTPASVPADSPVLKRFVELAGGKTIYILATGYPSNETAQAAADLYAKALGTPTRTVIVKSDSSAAIPTDSASYGGILVIAPDQSTINSDRLAPVKNAWLSGKPLLLDNAAAALAGAFYAAQKPTPKPTMQQPKADMDYIQNAFIDGSTKMAKGLGLLPVTVEPRLLADFRWGRLVALAHEHPDLPAFGIADQTALEVSRNGSTVIGTNGVVALDLRAAKLSLGTNKAYVFANGLLDTFAPGEAVQPAAP